MSFGSVTSLLCALLGKGEWVQPTNKAIALTFANQQTEWVDDVTFWPTPIPSGVFE
jgi:hypothetical protein